MDHQAVIAGVGIAGLSCARVLEEYGVNFDILESSDRPGGRTGHSIIKSMLAMAA